MPLKNVKAPKIIKANIATEAAVRKMRKQAVAIALTAAPKARPKLSLPKRQSP